MRGNCRNGDSNSGWKRMTKGVWAMLAPLWHLVVVHICGNVLHRKAVVNLNSRNSNNNKI